MRAALSGAALVAQRRRPVRSVGGRGRGAGVRARGARCRDGQGSALRAAGATPAMRALVRLPFNPAPRKARARASRAGGAEAHRGDAPLSGEVRLPFPGRDRRARHRSAGHRRARAPGELDRSARLFRAGRRAGAVNAHAAARAFARATFATSRSRARRVRSHDGVDVPVTIVHRRSTARDGSARVLLEAYGAYGIGEDPRFAPSLLAWLDRGGVYVGRARARRRRARRGLAPRGLQGDQGQHRGATSSRSRSGSCAERWTARPRDSRSAAAARAPSRRAAR